MEKYAKRLKDIINEQDFCFEPAEIRTVEKALGVLKKYEDNGYTPEEIEKLAADRKALINELCQYCGKYKQAHEGACDGCRWREM